MQSAMVALRKKADPIVSCGGNGNGETPKKILDYEQSREERIKENLERMKKLGILDLSLKLKSLNKPTPKSTPAIRRTLDNPTPLPPPGPRRRSSRLQNATPVNYSEVHVTKKCDSLEDAHDLLTEEGSKPESYTEEHEKLLGSTEMSWTLFVDGCGKDGKRIYDSVNGKTCHQCRQKTLGHRTQCSKCNKVQGQFCGDCLYMRYGEHVLEANQNPNWICPVCRGICNCSLCRQAKGWPPTGTLYRQVLSLGFKSVAHYLIQTRSMKSDSESNSGTKVPTSVKRSLPFSDKEATPMEKETSEINAKPKGIEYEHSEAQVTDNCLDERKQEEKQSYSEKGDCKLDPESDSELPMQPDLATNGNSVDPESVIGKERDLHGVISTPLVNRMELSDTTDTSAAEVTSNHSKSTISDATLFVAMDSVGGRLLTDSKHEEQLNSISTPMKAESTVNVPDSSDPSVPPITHSKSNKKRNDISEPSVDSIAGRLTQRRGDSTDGVTGRRLMDKQNEEQSSAGLHQLNSISTPMKAEEATVNAADSPDPGVVPSITRSKSIKKRIHISEPSLDSIAGRLIRRRGIGKVV